MRIVVSSAVFAFLLAIGGVPTASACPGDDEKSPSSRFCPGDDGRDDTTSACPGDDGRDDTTSFCPCDDDDEQPDRG